MFGLCPRCKSRIKINNVERLNGRKIACRDCGYQIRIRAPKRALAGKDTADLEVVEVDEDESFTDNLEESAASAIEDDDEFADAIDDDAPAYKPLAPRPRKKAPKAKADAPPPVSVVAAPRPAPRKGSKKPLIIGLLCLGTVVVIGGLIGGLVLLRKPARFEPPEKYVAVKTGIVPMNLVRPEDWSSTAGGGIGGVPMWVKINDRGSIFIEIRETEGSSAKGKMKKAIMSGQEVNQIGGPSMGRLGEAPGIESTHAYHKSVVIKDFSNYKEGAAKPIETGFGEALISDFTAGEGLFRSKIKGCRASVVHRDHQYSIVCKCPPEQFKDVKPVFEKIIGSMAPIEGPGDR